MVKRAWILGMFCLLGGAPPAGAAPSVADQAKQEFDKANRFFEAHEYAAALPHYEQAYRLSKKRPSTIRALAQCERALNHYDDALAHFREYLATKPRPSDAGAIEDTIALILEVKAEADRAAAGPSPSPAPSPVAVAPSPLPSPTSAPPPPAAVAAAPAPPAAEASSVWSSPVLWVAGAIVLVGGGVAVGVVAAQSSTPAPYGGSSGIVLNR
ncbi:MAG: tetratricopeptide repeat protein [Myxococcota bacterium]